MMSLKSIKSHEINGKTNKWIDGYHGFDIRIPPGYGLDLDLWISRRWIMDWIWI